MRGFSPALPPTRRVIADDSISGIVTASDYSVTEGDTVTLTLEDTSIAGEVTASDYSVTEDDTVTLEFDAVSNTYQWIDASGDEISGETTVSTDWLASLTEQPPRIRVTNSTSGKSKVFRVDQPIVVSEGSPVINIDTTGISLLARYNFSDPTKVWADSSRTVQASAGGAIRAVTDDSGNGNHGTFGTDHIWNSGYVDIDQYLANGSLSVPITPSNRNLLVCYVVEPKISISTSNTTVNLVADSQGYGVFSQFPSFTDGLTTFGQTPPLGKTVLAMAWRTGSVTAWINGRTKATGGAPANATWANCFINGNTAGGFSWGQNRLHQVIVATANDLSDARIEQLIADLVAAIPNTNIDTGQKWIVMGDSIGTGYSLRDNWVNMVANQATTRPRLYNFSVSGATAHFSPADPGSALARDKVIVHLGTNDIFGGRTLQQCKDAISALEAVMTSGTIYFGTCLPRTAFDAGQESIRTDFNAWLISTYGSRCIDFTQAGLVSGDYYDGTHPNLSGHQKMADYVMDFFSV